jgi:two-component system, chemotaxis family, response regulator Rcp1
VENGEKCLAFLRKQGEYQNARTPDLILLDLNMPIMNGRQVLAEMIKDDHLKGLPVVILTTSEQEQEILKMYNMRCSSYIVKPVDFEQFLKVVRGIAEYWFTIVVLPNVGLTEKAPPPRAPEQPAKLGLGIILSAGTPVFQRSRPTFQLFRVDCGSSFGARPIARHLRRMTTAAHAFKNNQQRAISLNSHKQPCNLEPPAQDPPGDGMLYRRVNPGFAPCLNPAHLN